MTQRQSDVPGSPMRAAIRLKQKIKSEELTLGVLATDHVWPRLVEICSLAGLDYLIVDQEHGPHTDEEVAHVCQVGRVAGFPVLVRPVSTDYLVVRRAVDMGPCGLLLPGVDDTDQLDDVRDAVYMPPRGRRHPGGPGNHWLPDYQYETWRQHFEDHLIVLPQIETTRGLANVNAVAGHGIVTALAVGPYDLSASLGCCWDPENEKLQNALKRIREAGKAAGKNTWMIGDGPSLVQQGYTFVCVGEPSYILQSALEGIVRGVGAGPAGEA